MKKAVGSIFIIVLVSGSLFATSVKTIVGEMNERYRKIMEESGAIRITQEINSIANGAEISSTQIVLKKGSKYRISTVSKMDIDIEKIKNVILFDGIDLWFISPFVGITLMPKDQSLKAGVFDDFSKIIPFSSILSGTEKINGEDCYVLKTQEELDLPFSKIWVSKSRFVPLKASGNMSKKTVNLIFSDYKKINDIWGIPYKIQTFLEDSIVSSTIVTSVETGMNISDEIFDVKNQ